MPDELEWSGSDSEMIDLFRINAQILDMIESDEGIDFAIASLAAWMASARARLSPEELTPLTKVGGILFRNGLANKEIAPD